MATMAGRKAAIYVAKYPATSMTTEAMTGDTPKTTYKITNSAKRFFDPDTAMTVYYNGSPVTSYSEIQYPAGIVTWSVSPGSSAVTVSGKYLTVSQLSLCKEWTLDFDVNDVETTVFGDTGKAFTRTIIGGTVTLGRFVDSSDPDEIYTEMLAGRARLGVDLFLDATGGSEQRIALYGVLSGDSISQSVDGVVEESITLSTTGKFYVVGAL